MAVGTRLRFNLIDGPELRCAHCGEWWSITPEFWHTNKFDICRACSRDRSRLYQELRRLDPDYRRHEVEKSRRYRTWIKKHAPGYLEAYERERRARKREWLARYRAERGNVTRDCECGLSITANALNVSRIMWKHTRTKRHQSWRESQERAA